MQSTLSITDIMIEVLTQRAPLICEADLCRYLRCRGFTNSAIKRALKRLQRIGLLEATVINLPVEVAEPFEITAHMDPEALAVALQQLCRPLGHQVCQPRVVLSASPRLTGLCGKPPLDLVNPEHVSRFVRLGRAFRRIDTRHADLDWRTAWPRRKHTGVIARVMRPNSETIYFTAPPTLRKFSRAVAWIEATLAKEDRHVVC